MHRKTRKLLRLSLAGLVMIILLHILTEYFMNDEEKSFFYTTQEVTGIDSNEKENQQGNNIQDDGKDV